MSNRAGISARVQQFRIVQHIQTLPVRVRRFLAIEGHASLRTAAKPLGGIVQPTLHRQLVVLERDTGLELFRRQGRRRTLTYSTAGRKFATEARKALELIDGAGVRVPQAVRNSEAIVRLRPAPTPHPE